MVKRGDVFYCDLAGRVGSEQCGVRPVIVVQNDVGNMFSNTFVVVPLTTRRKPHLPTHVELTGAVCPNLAQSLFLGEQITTVDGSRFLSYIGHVDDLSSIDRALRVSLAI